MAIRNGMRRRTWATQQRRIAPVIPGSVSPHDHSVLRNPGSIDSHLADPIPESFVPAVERQCDDRSTGGVSHGDVK